VVDNSNVIQFPIIKSSYYKVARSLPSHSGIILGVDLARIPQEAPQEQSTSMELDAVSK
jgi:hypothetical protein